MKLLKQILGVIISASFFLYTSASVFCDGDDFVSADTEVTEYVCTAKSYCLMEAQTKTVLYAENENEKQSIAHLTKLMTILLAAEKIESKELSVENIITVSPHANSMNGTQIWLAVGEKISVEELLYSCTVGNANDAAVALAEAVYQTEATFVSKMNEKAFELGMTNTSFCDASGISNENVSTAYDLALLCSELSRYDFLTKYFTTWMLNVRYGQTELVNTNRLVRSYNGITGLKTSASEQSGECIAASAKRGDLKLCGVFLQCATQDDRFTDAKELMNKGFSSFQIYTPEIKEEYLADMKIENGRKQKVSLAISCIPEMLIPSGAKGAVSEVMYREESVAAPFSKNTKVGYIEYYLDDKLISVVDIVTEQGCKEVDFLFSFKRILLSLLK